MSVSSSVGTLVHVPHTANIWLLSSIFLTLGLSAQMFPLSPLGHFQSLDLSIFHLHVAYQTLLPPAKSCKAFLVQAYPANFMSTSHLLRVFYLWSCQLPQLFSHPLPLKFTYSNGLRYSKIEIGTGQTPCAVSAGRNLVRYLIIVILKI